jgi:16S rRNA (adenine1518-N6/adenine1519-N6)-dimethyltransferase
VVQSIVDSLSGIAGVLEIGPGPGILTGPVSRVVEKVIALEIDPRMTSALAQSAPNVEVLMGDALVANLPEILARLPEPRAIVSNLPYYITGSLVGQIAEARVHYDRAVLMMQKEVAHRIRAKAGATDRGSLSVYLQTLFEITPIAEAPAKLFVPPPKVDSSVLCFRPRPSGMTDEFQAKMLRLVRISFAQRRKTLVNNLVGGRLANREEAIAWVERAGLKPTARPQELTHEEWRVLAETTGIALDT